MIRLSAAAAALRRLLLLPPRLFQVSVQRRARQAPPGGRRSAPEPTAQARQRRDADGERGGLPRGAGLRPGAVHTVRGLRPAGTSQASSGETGEGVVGPVHVDHRLHRGLLPPSCAGPSNSGLNPILSSSESLKTVNRNVNKSTMCLNYHHGQV